MLSASLIIDTWKLPLFVQRFNEAKLNFTQGAGVTPDTVTLKVAYEDKPALTALTLVVRAAHEECAERKAKWLAEGNTGDPK